MKSKGSEPLIREGAQSPLSGAKPPEAESFLAFERQLKVAKLPSPYFVVSKVFMGVQY